MNETFKAFNLFKSVLSHNAQCDKVGKIRHTNNFWKSWEKHLKSLDTYATTIFQLLIINTIGNALQVTPQSKSDL